MSFERVRQRILSPRTTINRIRIALVAFLGLASCGLPESGPLRKNVLGGNHTGSFAVVQVNAKVTERLSKNDDPTHIPKLFYQTAPWNGDLLLPGETLTVRVWENTDPGLLTGGTPGASASVIENIYINEQGNITFPYVGTLHVAGKTKDQAADLIRQRLHEQTPDPQVLVNKGAGSTNGVVIVGDVGAAGHIQLTRANRTLVQALAEVGGLDGEYTEARVHLHRGTAKATLLYSEIRSGHLTNLNLRPGDQIEVERYEGSFIAFGAVGAQVKAEFPGDSIPLNEALATIGWLTSETADPKSVFVFRVLKDWEMVQTFSDNPEGAKREAIFAFDYTDPTVLFLANRFRVRDRDMIYVTEAPWARLKKTLSLFSSLISSSASVKTSLK